MCFNCLIPQKNYNAFALNNADITVRTPGRNDNFGFLWQGNITILTAGTYTFETISDDGSKLYFNAQYDASAIATVNNDGLHAPTSATGTVSVPSAGAYPISFTFFEKDGGETMQVYWSGPGFERQLIPNSAFTQIPPPPSSGLTYKYYEGDWNSLPDFNALTPVKTGNSNNADITVRTPGRNDNFGFLWQGNITIPTAGTYTFETISDDGSKLYFNAQYDASAIATVSNDGLHAPNSATGMVSVPAAGTYPIAITFFEKDGGETMQVYWTGPGISRQLIPNSAFIPAQPVPNAVVTGGNRLTGHDVDLAVTNAAISKVYPNPFTSGFNVDFYNSSTANDIHIDVYDLKGKLVYQQHAGNMPKGNITMRVGMDALPLPWGVYMAGLKINGTPSKMVKLVKIK